MATESIQEQTTHHLVRGEGGEERERGGGDNPVEGAAEREREVAEVGAQRGLEVLCVCSDI